MKNEKVLWAMCFILLIIWLLMPKPKPYFSPYPMYHPTLTTMPSNIIVSPVVPNLPLLQISQQEWHTMDRHEFWVYVEDSYFPVRKFSTYKRARQYILSEKLYPFPVESFKTVHCHFKHKPFQRKHITTQSIIECMPEYDTLYNIMNDLQILYPDFPINVIHAKLKQLQYKNIGFYYYPTRGQAVRHNDAMTDTW